MNELLTLPASELAHRVRVRAVSPVELVDVHLARVLEVNARLNAVVEPAYERARVLARDAETHLARRSTAAEDLPPLFGVPCTVKETFAVAGMRWSAGLVCRMHLRAERNATVVDRLLAAGAIPLGTTNVPEAAMWYESYNRIYGRTANPYDVRCIPGGSSGGEAAIIGAGGSPFGVGSDIGGSIRMPAHFCGVAGHKPSPGYVPNTGQFPLATGEVLRYAVVGPLARRASDLDLLMRIFAGPDGEDPSVDRPGFAPEPLPDPRRMRVYFWEHGQFASTPAMQRAVVRAARALADRGMHVEPWRPRLLDRGLEIWLATLDQTKGEPFASILGGGTPIRPFRELARLPFARSAHTLPALLFAAMEAVAPAFPALRDRLAALRHDLRAEIEARLDGDAVLLAPPFPRTAPRHDAPLLRPFEWISTGILNVLELPATCVCVGHDERDLPTGVQVVGRSGRDALTIAVARALEEDLGGWRPPRGLHAV